MNRPTSTFAACFFDALGQKELYRIFKGNSTEWELTTLGRQMDAVKGFLQRCRDIPASMGRNPDAWSSFLRENYQQEMRDYDEIALLADLKDLEWGVQPFSDGVLLYVRVGNTLSGFLFRLWMTELAERMVKFHHEKIQIRGAFSVGDAWRVEGGSLCGPLVDEVGALERNVALYSRIIAGSGFKDFISGITNKGKLAPADGLWIAFRHLVEGDVDGCLVLDYLGDHMMREVDSVGETTVRLDDYDKSRALICDVTDNLQKGISALSEESEKTQVAWKYVYLRRYYDVHATGLKEWRRKLSNTLTRSESVTRGSPVWYKTPCSYLVCYFHLEALHPVPAKKDDHEAIDALCYPAGTAEGTHGLLSSLIGQFNLTRREWLEDPTRMYRRNFIDYDTWTEEQAFVSLAKDLSIGVEQIGNYVLFYVRNCNALAPLCFVTCLQMVSHLLVRVLSDDHVFYGACAEGIGWELAQDELMGPVIGSAHNLSDKFGFYPRFVVSPNVNAIMKKHTDVMKVFQDGPTLVGLDADGLFFWDYLSIWDKGIFEAHFKSLDFVETLEFVYRALTKRIVLLLESHGEESARVAMLRKLSMLQLFLGIKLKAYGADDEIIQRQILKEVGGCVE